MALRVTETIQGVLLFVNANQRNTAKTRISNYLGRNRYDVDGTPGLLDVDSGKYGPGFGIIVNVRFLDRADADEVWSDVEANTSSFVQPGSFLQQHTSTEDNEAVPPINEITVIDSRTW